METFMDRRNVITIFLGAALLLLSLSFNAVAQDKDVTGNESMATVMAFMDAMGKGDMKKLEELMADDMVWHNEGDSALPWLGPWEGKDQIFKFLGLFGENFQTTLWKNTDAFASGDTVAMFGTMDGVTTKSGAEIGEFTFALRAKVRDGKLVLWNWFEDSFAVSQAYHAK